MPARAATLAERAAGTLWGLAWGDVLGAPVERWSAAEIASTYGSYDGLPASYPPGVPAARRARLRPLGAHTDDTQQALALVNVCLSGWSPSAWGRCLVAGAKKGSWRGTGRHFDNAVKKLEGGAPPERAGSPSAGIGAAMRIAPLGALYRDASRTLAEVALEASAVTHADLRSMALAYAVAWACAQLVNGASVDAVRDGLPDAVAEVEDEWLSGRGKWPVERGGRHQLSLGLARVLAAMPQDVVGVGEVVVRLARPFVDPAVLFGGGPGAAHKADGQAPLHPSQAFSLLGGLFGLCAALVDDVDPREALLDIVRQGEDTDTVAAIAGGVLGARFGDAWVDKDRITDRARVALYARALVDRSGAPEPLDVLLDAEAALTAQDKAFVA